MQHVQYYDLKSLCVNTIVLLQTYVTLILDLTKLNELPKKKLLK